MSYCRFGWDGSDVYVFGTTLQTGAEMIECCGCALMQGRFYYAKTALEMIQHLAEHKGAGHFVPTDAIMRLWDEIAGPKVPVRPEPEVMTEARRMMEEATKGKDNPHA